MAVTFEKCECGGLATRWVWVRQFSGTGSQVTNRLRVCQDCFDVILAEDPGASATPLPRRVEFVRQRRAVMGAGDEAA